ncbi:uncharacterized protein LOC111135751 [Crassostrea virginica]|uniref:Uncharacterized protein LOC111135751 n=1 Tax=Crassostrea virginica TaxID=6565 RepID=A0A8B8EPC9_CRAVI|nr:uncharacterized protein LOC111135751 [Crassostrea virginica]
MTSDSVHRLVIADEETPDADDRYRPDEQTQADLHIQRPDELEEEIAEIRKGAKGIYSQGLINISLLSSNATQLRSAQSKTESRNRTTVICLILVSIVIQIIILLLLFALCIIPKGKVYRNRPCCTWKWLQMNRILCKSLVLFFVSILTAVNVFISAYHID